MKLFHSHRPFAVRSARPAFTMAEMLVAVGIIILIMSLVIPMLGKANKTAQRTRQAADLQSIAQALEAYRADMHDYPRLPPGMTANDPNFQSGAELLCWALLSPGPAVADNTHPVGDGADGMGFRTRGTKGQVYGPYLTPGKFRLYNMNSTNSPNPPPPLDDDSAMVILDYWDHPVYYCPATPNTDPTVAPPQGGGYVVNYAGNGPRPMYDPIYFTEPSTPKKFSPALYQNQDPSVSGTQNIMSLTELQEMLGDLNHNGTIDATDPKHPDVQQNLPFLLWSAGPNGRFGYDRARGAAITPNKSDDVTNFTIYFPAQ